MSQPREKRNAAQISFIRTELSCVTRLPNHCCETVTAWWRFTAQEVIPSSSVSTTSDGAPRIMDVIGATVTVER